MKTKLISIGGKLWKKEQVERIYLNAEVIIAFLNLENLTKFELTSIKKSKTFFDVNTNEFKSDVGTVRVIFNRNGIECTK